MPRDLVYGPLEGQGLGLKNIRVMQLIEHLDQYMRHAGRDTLTGKLLGNCYEAFNLPWELQLCYGAYHLRYGGIMLQSHG